MAKEEKKGNSATMTTRILMGVFTVLAYGVMFFQDRLHINMDQIMSIFMLGFYIPAVVFTGIRAKQLGRSAGGWAIGSFFGGLIPSVVLFFLGKKPRLLLEEKYKKTLLENKQRKVEKAILSFAKQNKGYVSVSHAAIEAEISMEEAQKVLDDLVKKGFAQLEVKSSGTLMYVFQDFLDDK
jgi:predicted transcriptional regulator